MKSIFINLNFDFQNFFQLIYLFYFFLKVQEWTFMLLLNIAKHSHFIMNLKHTMIFLFEDRYYLFLHFYLLRNLLCLCSYFVNLNLMYQFQNINETFKSLISYISYEFKPYQNYLKICFPVFQFLNQTNLISL